MNQNGRFELSIEGDLARLRLVRTDADNAIDPAWVAALQHAVDECERADGVRCLLISADGPRFSVGGDLQHFAGQLHRLHDALDEMTRPTTRRSNDSRACRSPSSARSAARPPAEAWGCCGARTSC